MVSSSVEAQQLALPAEILLLAESQWLFSDDELLRTPSILDGLTSEKERDNRSKGVFFLQQVGIMLKLPQITLATASVFLHRFYVRHTMQDREDQKGFHQYPIAATCLFLATKVEENCRKMRELVIACVRVAQKDPNKLVDEQDKEYWKWRDNILHNEDTLLEALCFDLTLEPPYKTLFELLCRFRLGKNKPLRNAAWAFLNDSYMTVLCLQFPSRTIAASALYAAAKHCEVTIPDDEKGRAWWEAAGADVRSLTRACNVLADVYEPIQATRGQRSAIVYERTTVQGDGSADRTRAASVHRPDQQPDPTSIDTPHSDETSAMITSTKTEPEDSKLAVSINGTDTKPQASNGTSPKRNHSVNGVANDAESSSKRRKTNGEDLHPNGTNGLKNGEPDGLVSPKLEEGSEEGELEA